MIDFLFILSVVFSCAIGLAVGHSGGRSSEEKVWRRSLHAMTDKEWEEHRKMYI